VAALAQQLQQAAMHAQPMQRAPSMHPPGVLEPSCNSIALAALPMHLEDYSMELVQRVACMTVGDAALMYRQYMYIQSAWRAVVRYGLAGRQRGWALCGCAPSDKPLGALHTGWRHRHDARCCAADAHARAAWPGPCCRSCRADGVPPAPARAHAPDPLPYR
jgi:hypothetical protein